MDLECFDYDERDSFELFAFETLAASDEGTEGVLRIETMGFAAFIPTHTRTNSNF